MGRHARELCSRGYSVVGVDRDDKAITAARELNDGPAYLKADIRNYRPEPNSFDLVIVMGQSFGHFDQNTNQLILSRLAGSLGKGGRLILDVWNPAFFLEHQGEHDLDTARGHVREIKRVKGNRLFVQLNYPTGGRENFEWQLFTTVQLRRIAASIGLQPCVACTGFDSTKLPSSGEPRLQFVLETS